MKRETKGRVRRGRESRAKSSDVSSLCVRLDMCVAHNMADTPGLNVTPPG